MEEEKEEDDLSDSSSESMQLRIAESPKKKRKRRSKQMSPSSDEIEEFKKLDKTIEDTISKCKNLTSDAARKMLYKLVKNDHVLALTLLKAEEEENLEKWKKEEYNNSSEEEMDKKSENDGPITPKLTRLKAKQLNKQLPLPELSLTTPKPDDEVVKLINEELHSDEEDEEYQPDILDSDGDITNTTFSDIDSQPSTPGSALINDSPQKDGEFKIPRTPLSAEEQENIARRTRSKLCLQTTSIETIESTFIPPDIDIDMYDFDMYENEDDNEWKEFLNEFMQPLAGHSEEIDDDQLDPEYIAEPMPLDKEELKPVRVSKKELNQLISELLEDSCSTMFDNEPIGKKTENVILKNTKKQVKTPPSKVKSQFQSPKTNISTKSEELNELNTPPHSTLDNENKNLFSEKIPEQFTQAPVYHHYYSPVQLQTPQRSGYFTPTYQSPNTSLISPMIATPPPQIITPSPLIVNRDLSPASIIVINQNQLEFRPIADANSIMSQGYFNNGFYTLPQYLTVQVPTIDLLQNGLNFTTPFVNNNSLTENLHAESSVHTEQNLTDDSKQNLKRESKLKSFDYLNYELPKPPLKFDEKAKGFTMEQTILLEEQFRMHCQMLAQNYLQFYAHPKLWDLAQTQKEKLLELEKICPKNNKSHFYECVNLCNKWEKDLEENNEKNKNYMEFLHEEVELDEEAFKEHKFFKGRFHNRLMEAMLQSKAIIYVSLLPKIPFRAVKYSKIDPSIAELKMIALGIERAHDKIYHELNSLNPIRLREPKITSIASEVVRILNSFRSHKSMLKIIETYKNHTMMNPIKYYFQHRKAPSIIHPKIEAIDLKNVQPPMNLRRGVLPKLFENYKFSFERLQIYPFTGYNGERCETNANLKKVPLDNEIGSQERKELIEGATEKKSNTLQKINLDDKFQLEIVCDEIPRLNITFLTDKNQVLQENNDNLQKRNPLLKNWQKTNEEKQRNLTSILKKVTSNVQSNQPKKKTVNFLLPVETNQTKCSVNFSKEIKASFIAKRKFKNIIETFFTNFSKNFTIKDDIPLLIRIIFIRIRSFDIYWKLVNYTMLSKKNKDGTTNGSSSTTSESFLKPKRPLSSEEYSKKINRKLKEYRGLIFQNAENCIEKDCSFAINYLEKVKRTLVENGDDELFGQFTRMLTAFNPEIESVPELYYKMETLLLPGYPDLLDLFLNFLLPEHAAEIGKFCEHFLLTNMSNLIEKLNFFFRKQPSSLKKIYACINELSTESDLTIESIKLKILPLMKGNQLLIDWFMELFDRPPENNIVQDEYETLHLKKFTSESEMVDDEYEEMQSQEFIDSSENNNLPVCGVKYINGKIMYRSKTLLPAKISFLACDAMIDDKPNKDDENSSSLCIHEIRKHIQYNDGKKSNDNEDSSKVKKKKTNIKKYKVCDSQTLRAHAIRLNSIHAQNGEKMSDVIHLLDASTKSYGNQESPKKGLCRNTKKILSNSPKKILKSPSSSSSSDISTTNFSSPSPTKALDTKPQNSVQIVKKVRTIIINNNTTDDDQPTKKQKITENLLCDQQIQPLSNSNDEEEIIEEEKPNSSNNLVVTTDIVAWTRDEDKMILEEIKNGFSIENKENLINSLAVKLKNRDRSEIQERYEFLLNFVTYLTSS
ncbi:hypothetical protein PVAND_010402 [Polypedilum vanderplanki]|uniref:Myb-like domain-containing protein n=1 Tax=Polypedilum vanderplanki TaxID=319348 RepID=A0A9J6CH55_POLVA|nr:hypothetical protein PVAND_010402 [Polypedilum vanderplanki]